MSYAISVDHYGGPEVLQWKQQPLRTVDSDQVQIEQTAVGLNFIDVYHRTGLYPISRLPFTPGLEAAGVVTDIGAAVTEFSIGDRVAYVDVMGAYCDTRNVPADRVIKLPDDIDETLAGGALLKGLTAYYLLFRSYQAQAGETILVHAAAGGVGQILCQWAAHLGIEVIGTVGSEEKAEIARAHGCRHPIVYTREDVVDAVRCLTDGEGVPVVYDSVGRDTFEFSLDCLKPFGVLVSFGQSSGKVPPFDIGILSAKGSLYVTRPTLMHHIRRREDLLAMSDALFDVLRDKVVKVNIAQSYPLREASRAHADLEQRRTSGSSILLP